MPSIEPETSHVQDGPTPISSTTLEIEEEPRLETKGWQIKAPSVPIGLPGHFFLTTVLTMILGVVKTAYSHRSGGPVVTVVLDWVLVFLPFM